jgi:hypothetical protein
MVIIEQSPIDENGAGHFAYSRGKTSLPTARSIAPTAVGAGVRVRHDHMSYQPRSQLELMRSQEASGASDHLTRADLMTVSNPSPGQDTLRIQADGPPRAQHVMHWIGKLGGWVARGEHDNPGTTCM